MKGGDGEKNEGTARVFHMKARLGRTASRFLFFSFCQDFLHFSCVFWPILGRGGQRAEVRRGKTLFLRRRYTAHL